MRWRRRGGDRGSIPVEAVVLIGGLMLFMIAAVVALRISVAAQAVHDAAAQAARHASLSASAGDAQQNAYATAVSTMTGQDLSCATTSVEVDTSGFSTPIGTLSTVSATVTCVVDFSDVAVAGMPGSLTLTESATSPLDRYRVRS